MPAAGSAPTIRFACFVGLVRANASWEEEVRRVRDRLAFREVCAALYHKTNGAETRLCFPPRSPKYVPGAIPRRRLYGVGVGVRMRLGDMQSPPGLPKKYIAAAR